MRDLVLAAARVTAMPLALITTAAQAAAPSPLLDMAMRELRNELTERYDTALAAIRDPAVKASLDTRFVWATEAKNQCGIAIGFTKTNTKDADSINKCDAFAARLAAPPEINANSGQ